MQAQPVYFLNLLSGDVQYVIPRWQRRYCWGEDDIQRLIEDLKTVAAADSDATHYAGTLLTLNESMAAGTVSVYRVVDGQQRLTTISILLACIAEAMGDDTQIGDWTKQKIINKRLINLDEPIERRYKIKLQGSDNIEYIEGIIGSPAGFGAVSQAWNIIARLVGECDLNELLSGLEKLQVVTIGLSVTDDPQQIFESINATGRPLTESEKIKNWILIGLPSDQQIDLHDNVWAKIEHSLGAEETSESIDSFFRDFLRWQTGEHRGMASVYDQFRRWAIRTNEYKDRPALCVKLSNVAHLYGLITGTAGVHKNKVVASKLEHLKLMGIDIHRPFTLRLIHDCYASAGGKEAEQEFVKSISYVSTWITRLWLADKPMTSLSKAFTDLAYDKNLPRDEASSEYWKSRICARRNSKIGVPLDDEVVHGILNRTAYGGVASKSTFAIFCALMRKEHGTESPPIKDLTIEHVMPRSLTKEWKEYLGEDADSIHARLRNRLGNLTLCGNEKNSMLGTSLFEHKKPEYAKSSIDLTRQISCISRWGEDAIEQRASDYTSECLTLWPWIDEGRPLHSVGTASQIRWRIADEPWRVETTATQMVINVVSRLLDLDPLNEERLSGDSNYINVQPASKIHVAISEKSKKYFKSIPGHEHLVVYPYANNYKLSAKKCSELCARCNVRVDIELPGNNIKAKFWSKLRQDGGGLPGLKENMRGPIQWLPDNSGNYVSISIGSEERVLVYIKSGLSTNSDESIQLMKDYSAMIKANLSDQTLFGNVESEALNGRSVSVERLIDLHDEAEWPATFEWLRNQCDRLHQVMRSNG